MSAPSWLYRCGPCDQSWSCESIATDGGLSPCPRCSTMRPALMREEDLDEDEGDEVERLTAERDQLRAAAGAMLAAFGGDVPDWLRTEAAALQAALDGSPAEFQPAPQMTGAQVLLIPYQIDPTTDDASILRRVGAWLDGKGDALKADLAAALRSEAPEDDA